MKPSHHDLIDALRSKLRETLYGARENGAPREIGARDEVCVGALIGCSACIAMTWNSSLAVIFVAAIFGLCVGALVGLLLWSASTDFIGETVLAPAAAAQRGSRHCTKNACAQRRGPPGTRQSPRGAFRRCGMTARYRRLRRFARRAQGDGRIALGHRARLDIPL